VPIKLSDSRKKIRPKDVEKVAGVALGGLAHHIAPRRLISVNANDGLEDVIRCLCRFVNDNYGGGFSFMSITLNRNFAANWHRDGNNLGDSLAIAFGPYTGGGDLIIRNASGEEKVISTKNCFAKFDGNDLHKVSDFQLARTSMVFYTPKEYDTIASGTIEKLEAMGFPVRAALRMRDGHRLHGYLVDALVEWRSTQPDQAERIFAQVGDHQFPSRATMAKYFEGLPESSEDLAFGRKLLGEALHFDEAFDFEALLQFINRIKETDRE
jgi:hypothetical protein